MAASAIVASMRHPARLTLENTMTTLNRWTRNGATLLLLSTAPWIPGGGAQAADMPSPLAGSWTLVAADVLHADGSRGHDYGAARSEEHTSELQSLRHLVCRLLLE